MIVRSRDCLFELLNNTFDLQSDPRMLSSDCSAAMFCRRKEGLRFCRRFAAIMRYMMINVLYPVCEYGTDPYLSVWRILPWQRKRDFLFSFRLSSSPLNATYDVRLARIPPKQIYLCSVCKISVSPFQFQLTVKSP